MITNFSFARTGSVIGLCLTIVWGAGCHHHQGGGSVYLPASNEVAGWVRSIDVRSFPAADLWRYIDGDAERYLKAGVQSVATADYRFRDKFDATVDLYTMTTAAGAQQVFDSEPAGDAKLIQLGDGARLYSQSLVVRNGVFLVRITAYESSAETQEAIAALGRAIAQRLAS